MGGEHGHVPLNRIGGLYEISLHKMALEAENVNSNQANFKAQANAAFRSHQDWNPTGFTDPKYHLCAYKGKSYLSGELGLWHRRMRHVPKGQLKQVSAHGITDGFNSVGRKTDTQCKCDTCAMAKTRKHASRRAKYVDAPKGIGEHVSPDLKSVPYEALKATSTL